MSSALIVVDMQRDLCRDPRRQDKVEAALPSILKLIAACSDMGCLIVYSVFSLAPDDEQFERFGDRYCIEGTPGAELISELLPLKGPKMAKRKHSVFFETELDQLLRARGVQRVLFAGLQTQICILTSAADASFRGYEPVAVRECVVSSNDQAKADALAWISRYVGGVVSVDEAITSIGSGARGSGARGSGARGSGDCRE
jgi:nicotinamidase-related amidase